MTARTAAPRVRRVVSPSAAVPVRGHRPARRAEAGWLSLEVVMMLPVLALLVVGLLEVVGVVRDVLLVHEAARAGARAAATSTGEAAVRAAVDEASPELSTRVSVSPARRADGDLVTVTVVAQRRIGPVTHRVRGKAVARVEPAVGTTPGVRGGWP